MINVKQLKIEMKRMNETIINPRKLKNAFTLMPVEVNLKLDLDLALALGDFILEHRPENTAILAMAHQLQNILPPEPEVAKS